MKTLVASSLAVGLFMVAIVAPAAPAMAQANLTGTVLADICLPYAGRSLSFERSIRVARDLKFRRPADERDQPMDEYASDINLVSNDGAWRVRLEEGSVEYGDREAYYVSCLLSSTRASARELAVLGRRAFSDERYWAADEASQTRWERRYRNPEERRLEVEVIEEPGQRPALRIRGLYF
ncbi:hypothetical protein [Brevundimonas sp. M20]|uniref:hypothetical protein n=1 Tax=Brevundimonas sp. M20 TaxID=2591463 RepID=UPI0011469452|nr:hypothetical protein [Brevundimonas sp. M20]QDH72559.1 hypothetical protein FKQ52_03395 [Brevundimonas sp. M20]